MSKKNATFLLMAGTWCGSWCWEPVAERLRAEGHHVISPSFSGLADRAHLLSPQLTLEDHIMDIINSIKYHDVNDVILAGHSYAGFPIICALDRLSRESVRHVFYIDGLLPEHGESGASMMLPEEAKKFFQGSLKHNGLAIPVPHIARGKFPAERLEWFQRLMTPHPVRTYQDHACLLNEQGNGFPTTFVACSHTRMPVLLKSRRRAQMHSHWNIVPLDSAHNAHVLHPDIIADMLLNLV